MTNIMYYGRKKYGPGFKLYKEDQLTWLKLFAYFTKDKALCSKYSIDLRKGLMLSGPVGCGKTSMLTLWNIILAKDTAYTIQSSNQLALQFAEKGHTIINTYGNLRGNLLIDDIGAEQNIKHYGNDSNVIQEILTLRYEAFINFGYKTHLTTNLTSSELEQEYGKRIRSRLKAMVSNIPFNDSVDKR